MPTLKQLTCNVEWSSSGPSIPLEEFQTAYMDGLVETFIAVPLIPTPFSIRLQSDGYIAPGLSMFVYIDGEYQCNRGRNNLKIPNELTPKHHTNIDFVVRQKEEALAGGQFLGKQWRFEELPGANRNVGQTSGASENCEYLGTIEVVVLRCFAIERSNQPQPSISEKHPIAFVRRGSLPNVKAPLDALPTPETLDSGTSDDEDESSDEAFGDLFDGAVDSRHSAFAQTPFGGDGNWDNEDSLQQNRGDGAGSNRQRVQPNYNNKSSPAVVIHINHGGSGAEPIQESGLESQPRGLSDGSNPNGNSQSPPQPNTQHNWQAWDNDALDRGGTSEMAAWAGKQTQNSPRQSSVSSMNTPSHGNINRVNSGAQPNSGHNNEWRGTANSASNTHAQTGPTGVNAQSGNNQQMNGPGNQGTNGNPNADWHHSPHQNQNNGDNNGARFGDQKHQHTGYHDHNPTDVNTRADQNGSHHGAHHSKFQPDATTNYGHPTPHGGGNPSIAGGGVLPTSKDTRAGAFGGVKSHKSNLSKATSIKSAMANTGWGPPIPPAASQLGSKIPIQQPFVQTAQPTMPGGTGQGPAQGASPAVNNAAMNQQAQAYSRFLPATVTPIRPYWATIDALGNPRLPVSAPPPTASAKAVPALDHSVNASRLVKQGNPTVYQHKIATPKYMDTHDRPYAIFVFKYRSKDTLECMLNVSIPESDEVDKLRLSSLSKEELIEQVVKSKVKWAHDCGRDEALINRKSLLASGASISSSVSQSTAPPSVANLTNNGGGGNNNNNLGLGLPGSVFGSGLNNKLETLVQNNNGRGSKCGCANRSNAAAPGPPSLNNASVFPSQHANLQQQRGDWNNVNGNNDQTRNTNTNAGHNPNAGGGTVADWVQKTPAHTNASAQYPRRDDNNGANLGSGDHNENPWMGSKPISNQPSGRTGGNEGRFRTGTSGHNGGGGNWEHGQDGKPWGNNEDQGYTGNTNNEFQPMASSPVQGNW